MTESNWSKERIDFHRKAEQVKLQEKIGCRRKRSVSSSRKGWDKVQRGSRISSPKELRQEEVGTKD